MSSGFGEKWNKFDLPPDMTDKTFLDVGTWDGGLCIEALKRGATESVGVDICACDKLRENLKKHDFAFHQIDIQSERFLTLGRFDIVVFCGVLYHLSNPMDALIRLRNVTKEILVLETRLTNINVAKPIMEFTPGEVSNWWAPNIICLRSMLDIAGFRVFKSAFIEQRKMFGRTCVHARPKGRGSLKKISPRTPRFSLDPNPII